MTKSLRSGLIRLAQTQPEFRPHLLPLLTEKKSSAKNPDVSVWSRKDGTFAIKIVNNQGEKLWTGDGWKHSMDFIRDQTPALFSSKAEALKELETNVLPYIAKWQPGYWEDYVRGWDEPKGIVPR